MIMQHSTVPFKKKGEKSFYLKIIKYLLKQNASNFHGFNADMCANVFSSKLIPFEGL